jgi:hypothetical protein
MITTVIPPIILECCQIAKLLGSQNGYIIQDGEKGAPAEGIQAQSKRGGEIPEELTNTEMTTTDIEIGS